MNGNNDNVIMIMWEVENIILKIRHVINCNNGLDDNNNVGSGKYYLEMFNM